MPCHCIGGGLAAEQALEARPFLGACLGDLPVMGSLHQQRRLCSVILEAWRGTLVASLSQTG